jgi:hypothetical protein
LSHLELFFSESEVYAVIKEAPKDKAPGSDGFIKSLLYECWELIKEDLLSAIYQFYHMNRQELHLLNQAYVVLIPKK